MADPMKTSLKQVLAGIEFPEETITVFLNAKQMYLYSKAKREWDSDPVNDEKRQVVEAYESAFENEALKVTVRDIPLSTRRAVVKKVRSEFPPSENMFGAPIDTPEGFEEINTRLWALYIVSMEHNGKSVSVEPDDIRTLRESAPDVTLEAISNAIDQLTEGAKSGYEQIVQAPGFLSQPSPMG